MNKDYEHKNDEFFHSTGLRRRISAAIKSERDEEDETKHPQAKNLLLIPITGTNGEHKYMSNKQKGKYYPS